jgi:hypothetical protein
MVNTPVSGPGPETLTNISASKKNGNDLIIVITVDPKYANLPTIFFEDKNAKGNDKIDPRRVPKKAIPRVSNIKKGILSTSKENIRSHVGLISALKIFLEI